MVVDGCKRVFGDIVVRQRAHSKLQRAEYLPLEGLHRKHPRDKTFSRNVTDVSDRDRQLRGA